MIAEVLLSRDIYIKIMTADALTTFLRQHGVGGHSQHQACNQDRWVQSELLDGFTIEQWSTYATRKAAIATSICRENGLLKAKLDARQQGPAGDYTSPGSAYGTDLLFLHDPWRKVGALSSPGASIHCRTNICQHDWSTWRPSAVAAAERLLRDIVAQPSAKSESTQLQIRGPSEDGGCPCPGIAESARPRCTQKNPTSRDGSEVSQLNAASLCVPSSASKIMTGTFVQTFSADTLEATTQTENANHTLNAAN